MTDSTAPLGILLTNLGTPDAPTTQALRRYLAEFLWDRRVVDVPRPLWWLILHGIILRTRPARSARLYRKVWTAEGSPLLLIVRRQQVLLQQALETQWPGRTRVALGMRYGNPSIAAALNELRAAGVQQVLVLPLYPQNSCSTTASTFDAVAAALRATRDVPSLRFVADYHADAGYLDALAASVREARQEAGPVQRLLFSFHGTPERYRSEGDPYYQQCLVTARLTAERLGLKEDEWQVSFQSRFGREPWLQPYTDAVLRAWPAQGIRHVQVICPGFSADCLETLEEIAGENRELFLHAGGESFHYIPALNDRPEHIAALAAIVARELCLD
ncbi:MAG: ferrochelatase [Thiohalomonadaceae bacterium]